MVKYSCENNADKSKALVDKDVEEKINNKKLIIEKKELIYIHLK